MFTLKSFSSNGTEGAKKDIDNIEDVPVYTMKKDIEKGKNSPPPQETIVNKPANYASVSDQSAKSSPFFGSREPMKAPEKNAPAAPVHLWGARPSPSPVNSASLFPNPNQRMGIPKETIRFKEESKTSWGKIIFIAFSLFLLLSIGLGGYYFWVTHSEGFPQIPWLSSKNFPGEKMPSFSATNPNYFNIDVEKASKEQIRDQINMYSKEMLANGITSSVEFVVSDLNNSPIDFFTFSQKMGISFSEEVMSNLDRDFSLFIYNDTGKPRLGLVISTPEGEKLRKALVQEEVNLPQDLEGIFSTPYSLEAKPFKNSSYSGIGIRYLNITSPEELSIDYTVTGNQLLIGTTKMTLRSMIDYLSGSTQAPSDDTN